MPLPTPLLLRRRRMYQLINAASSFVKTSEDKSEGQALPPPLPASPFNKVNLPKLNRLQYFRVLKSE